MPSDGSDKQNKKEKRKKKLLRSMRGNEKCLNRFFSVVCAPPRHGC
jgi:hypothetical protein